MSSSSSSSASSSTAVAVAVTPPKRLVIAGAGGRLGRSVLKAALAANGGRGGEKHRLVALVRSEAKFRAAVGTDFPLDKVEIAVGSVNDSAFLRRVLPGADSVISTFGHLDFPNILADNKVLIDAVVEAKVPNYIVTLSLGVLPAPPSSGKKYFMDVIKDYYGDWVVGTGTIFVQVIDYIKSKGVANWAALAPGFMIHQPTATPVPYVLRNESAGLVCTYEDLAAWAVANVHGLATSPFNKSSVSFGLVWPPVGSTLPATQLPYVQAMIDHIAANATAAPK